MSNQNLVNDALSLIGVLPEGQAASAEHATLALRVLNEMIEEWAEEDVVVSWNPSLTIDDDSPLVGAEQNAVKYHLAIRMCPHFDREPPSSIVAFAQSAYRRLQRRQMADSIIEITLDVPQSPSGYGYDILTDEH
jgi:hypothetical protein